MIRHRLGKCLFFLSFLSLTQCNLNEILTSLFIGSSVVSTAATIAGAVAENNLVQGEQAVSLNDNTGQSLAIISQDELRCDLLVDGHAAGDSEVTQIEVWNEVDGTEHHPVEVLSLAPLADSPDVQFSLYLLTDVPTELASETESELGEVLLVANTNLWAQNLVAALEGHTDDSRPILIINAATQVLLNDEDRQVLLDAVWQKDAFFIMDSQNAFGPLAEALAFDHRLLGTLTSDATDFDSVLAQVADHIDAAWLVSVPASACESGEPLQGEVI